jgi:hypothetical protein
MDAQLPKDAIGLTIYDGPSMLTGDRIVAIASGMDRGSRNRKTKEMIQTWIILPDMNPFDAVEEGSDEAVCGDCKHRHFRSCYVNLAHGPLHVYEAFQRGRYPMAKPEHLTLFKDNFVRMGSYGDPAAVPLSIWLSLVNVVKGWTAYTHAWKRCDPGYRSICMASVETTGEASRATQEGWRTFFGLEQGTERPKGFYSCPASKEAGEKRQCIDCNACNGGLANGKACPSIIAHGPAWKVRYFHDGMKRLRQKRKLADNRLMPVR